MWGGLTAENAESAEKREKTSVASSKKTAIQVYRLLMNGSEVSVLLSGHLIAFLTATLNRIRLTDELYRNQTGQSFTLRRTETPGLPRPPPVNGYDCDYDQDYD